MITLKSSSEIRKLRKSNLIGAEILREIKAMVEPGVATIELERACEEGLQRRGVKGAFKGYRGYPYNLCVSVNEEVVHGMPSNRVLRDGDIVSIDFGVLCEGFYGDTAITVPVGNISFEAEKLIRVTKDALDKGIDAAVVGNRLNDISAAVQHTAEDSGFSVVKAFVGHGIGRSLHESPQVPNFGVPGKGVRLKAGMVLAIEPMINQGNCDVKVMDDGWTAVTCDGRISAHFEHSVAITLEEPYILSRI